MITYPDSKVKLQDSVALWRFGVWAMTFGCILITIGYGILLCRANKTYYEASGTVFRIDGPQVDSYKGDKDYKFTYYCEFMDHEGNWMTGHFKKTNFKEDSWEYYRNQVVTIYYAEDFQNEGQINYNRPSKSGGAFLYVCLGGWLMDLTFVVIFALKRNMLNKLYGTLPKQGERGE